MSVQLEAAQSQSRGMRGVNSEVGNFGERDGGDAVDVGKLDTAGTSSLRVRAPPGVSAVQCQGCPVRGEQRLVNRAQADFCQIQALLNYVVHSTSSIVQERMTLSPVSRRTCQFLLMRHALQAKASGSSRL